MFLCADAEGNLDDRAGPPAPASTSRTPGSCPTSGWRSTGTRPLLLSTSAERGLRQPRRPGQPGPAARRTATVAPQRTINIRRTRVDRRPPVRAHPDQELQRRRRALTVELTFGTDFADIFEVRGAEAGRRGRLARPKADRRSAVFAYAGEDGVFRETRIGFELEPDRGRGRRTSWSRSTWQLRLEPTQTELSPSRSSRGRRRRPAPASAHFDTVMHELRRSYEDWERECTRVCTDNELFDTLLDAGPARPPRAAHADHGAAACSPPASPGTWPRSGGTR